MTSKEIQEIKPGDQSTNTWLKEIALQLAIQNERQAVPIVTTSIERKHQPKDRR